MVDRKQIVKNTVSFIKSEGSLEHKNRVQKLYWEYRKKGFTSKESWDKALSLKGV